MLIVNKTYRIVDDKNDTRITIEKDGGIYRWEVKNADVMSLASLLLTSICLIFFRLLRTWAILSEKKGE